MISDLQKISNIIDGLKGSAGPGGLEVQQRLSSGIAKAIESLASIDVSTLNDHSILELIQDVLQES